MRGIKPIITLGILSMILTICISIQLKTINAADIGESIKMTDSNLRKSLLQAKSKNEKLNKDLLNTDKELEKTRESIASDEISNDIKERLKKYEIILGLTDVKGEGIIITVADNNQIDGDFFSKLNAESYMVHDGNLVEIVNELKASNAEAISINGKRIVDSTCITCAGNVIQVNNEKIGSPFEIKAIGDKDLLYGALNNKDGIVNKLKKYGVLASISKHEKIEIKKII